VPAGDLDQAGLFVRKSSGLVRELGWRDTISIALGGGNPSYSLLSFAAFFAFVSNVNLTWPYLIAPILMLPLCYVYGQLVATMPRSGGDFIYFSRIYHPIAGAAVGLGFLIFLFEGVAGNSVGLPAYGMSEFFRAAGATGVANSLASSHTTQFLVGAGSLVLIFGLAALGPRMITRVTFWCFMAGAVGVLALIIVALTHSTADLIHAYNARTAPNAYDKIIAAASQAHVKTGSTFSGFLKYLPYAAIGFYGFTFANYPGGELKRRGRIYTLSTLVGLFATAIVIVVGWLGIRHLTGQLFFQSAAGLNAANSDTFSKITGGHGSTVALYYPDIVTSKVPALIISGGVALGYLVFALAVALVVSRLIFALAFDRLLPTTLADVNERTHVPTKALGIGLAGSILFTYLVAFSTGYAHAVRNAVLMWSFLLTASSLTVIAMIWRRRDLYESGPKVLGQKIGGIPLIAYAGAVSGVLQAILFYVAASNTGISGGYDGTSVGTLIGTLVIGVFVYAISRAYLKYRQGIDIDLAMRQLPPE
jgi:amino acid transporter